MELSKIIVILLAYLLTDNTIMHKALQTSSFFQDKTKLKRSLEITSLITLVLVIIIAGWLNGMYFALAAIFFSASRKRLRDSKVPKYLQGEPIILITAVFIAIAFYGLR